MNLDAQIEELHRERKKTRFSRLLRVCIELFGQLRINDSHHIFKTPWEGDPRINLQEVQGYAKPYQVEQVINALRKLRASKEEAHDTD